MKEFFKMFFASMLAMVVAGVLMIIFIVMIIAGAVSSMKDKNDKVVMGNVLSIDLTKRIHESGESNSLAALGNGSSYEAGLYDVSEALNHARTDNEIKGILIKLAGSPNGWATLQQLRADIAAFRASGKFVYAYGEDITQGAYYIASAADSIYLNPAGGIELKGFATVMPFFKGTLDKLELQPEIFYAGKFKSATEPFRADKISDPNRLQLAAMQNGLWDEFTAAAAQYTHTDKAAINKWATDGTIQFPADALKYKMVAGLLYWDEVEARIRKKTAQTENDAIKYVSLEDYVIATRPANRAGENKIALLVAEGDITDGEQNSEHEIASATFCEEIRKIRRDDRIKSVVLRINSPGGSAMASDVILRELMLLKQKKHIIVSMGDYAASGGYYIASGADSIFALPNTITGSIGVFSMMFSMDKLLKNKLGVTFDEVKNAPYADLPTSSRPLTPTEALRMQNSVDTIYALFKNHVVQGRHLNQSDVDSIAQGRVWTGTDALGIHLVDHIGGLDKAIACAAKMANLSSYKVVTYPEPEDKLTILMRRFKSNSAATSAIRSAIKEELGDGYGYYEKIQNLQKMNGRAMMIMPFVPVVN